MVINMIPMKLNITMRQMRTMIMMMMMMTMMMMPVMIFCGIRAALAAEAAAVRNLDDGGCGCSLFAKTLVQIQTGIQAIKQSNTLYCTLIHENKTMKGPNYPGLD